MTDELTVQRERSSCRQTSAERTQSIPRMPTPIDNLLNTQEQNRPESQSRAHSSSFLHTAQHDSVILALVIQEPTLLRCRKTVCVLSTKL